jgi:hypothetical protein
MRHRVGGITIRSVNRTAIMRFTADAAELKVCA